MRIAIISDIHGNRLALDAALEDMRGDGIDQIVCLGDAIQGGAQPAETVARLRELGCPVVMGNADAWLLTGVETGAEGPASEQLRAAREWSLAQLSEADRAFIAGFEPTVEIGLPGGRPLLCFHGSPRSFDDFIFPETTEEEAQRLLGGFGAAALAGGHTHLQQLRRVGDALFFNPGSVGRAFARHQPAGRFRFDPWAEYAVLSIAEGRMGLEFRRAPLDIAALARIILRSGRPYAQEAADQHYPAHDTA
jgi:predicted phosphodiesterase